MRKKLTKGHVVIVILLILAALVCLYPLWYTLIVSFSDKAYVEGGRVWIIPRGFNIKSYIKILQDNVFFSALFVSIKRVAVGCSLNMLLLVLTAFLSACTGRNFRKGSSLNGFLWRICSLTEV